MTSEDRLLDSFRVVHEKIHPNHKFNLIAEKCLVGDAACVAGDALGVARAVRYSRKRWHKRLAETEISHETFGGRV